MNDNPYAPPRADVTPAAPPDYAAGLWRDRTLIVLRIRNPRFPPRCVKTNQPFDGAPTQLDLDWIPNHQMWVFMLGALGHFIAKSIAGRKVSVQLPVSQEWLSQRARTSRTGWIIIIGGISCLVLSTVGYVAALVSGTKEKSMEWVMYFVLAAPLIAVAGVIFLFARVKPIATARKMTADHAWIDHINTDFLESLPEWPG